MSKRGKSSMDYDEQIQLELSGRSKEGPFSMGKALCDHTMELVIRVLVAEDSRLHTQLLADALRRDGAFEVTGSDSQELTAQVDLHNVDVLLLSSDLNEQPARGFKVLREIRASHPNLRAVMLLDSSKPNLVLEAFRAGARGVLNRQESIETLSKCVRSVYEGQIWANSQQMSLIIQALFSPQEFSAVNAKGIDELSKRELEVVDFVARGFTNRKIAERLGLSQHTVKNYLFHIFEKLGVSSRFELLSFILSRIEQPEPSANRPANNNAPDLLLTDSAVSGWRRAAEQGAMIAQLELARFYWTRKSDARDLIQAYKWYLIGSEQILRTSKTIGRAMTTGQKLEAEQMAAEWLKKPEKLSHASIRDQFVVTSGRRNSRGSE
jgi:two-component system, NarL family, nitrate/nitrite response regulator NarL